MATANILCLVNSRKLLRHPRTSSNWMTACIRMEKKMERSGESARAKSSS